MKFSKLISTVFLITSIITIYIFGMIFYLYLNANTNTLSILKDALSTTSGFLSGITTLAAAYTASKLFNNWKDVHNKTIDAQLCMRIYDFVDFANDELVSITGFIKDYGSINNKNEFKQTLLEHNRRLLNLHDLTVTKLSNLGYLIEEKEYTSNYLPHIDQLMKNLDAYIYIYKKYMDGFKYTKSANDEVNNKLDQLMIDTRNRYRSFIVELKKYYYA